MLKTCLTIATVVVVGVLLIALLIPVISMLGTLIAIKSAILLGLI